MHVSAKITGIKYSPFLCRKLSIHPIECLDSALAADGAFILKLDEKRQIALSWWVSAKRTRTYPYARVYNSLAFQGKKVTIIPFVKDEGKRGNRDFLQWDTISLMSLLGVYTIISYYKHAEQSVRYKNKITNQQFDTEQIKTELDNLLSYQSDALHWNLSQIEKIGDIAQKALSAYMKISKDLGIEMHSEKTARQRIQEILKGKESFISLSRELAKAAQNRESLTSQPKEKLSGRKGTLTIKNYLGGFYFLTSDEIEIKGNTIFLVESKHSKKSMVPSISDIKDGLVKMILFSNLKNVEVNGKEYSPLAVLKLTTDRKFSPDKLTPHSISILKFLKREAEKNNFQVILNSRDLQEINLPDIK